MSSYRARPTVELSLGLLEMAGLVLCIQSSVGAHPAGKLLDSPCCQHSFLHEHLPTWKYSMSLFLQYWNGIQRFPHIGKCSTTELHLRSLCQCTYIFILGWYWGGNPGPLHWAVSLTLFKIFRWGLIKSQNCPGWPCACNLPALASQALAL